MMLRGGDIPARGVWHKHTHLTEQLFMGVLETELLLQTRMAHVMAWASLHGHPSADLDQAGQNLRVHYVDAMSAIPYMTNGLSGGDVLQQERMDAAKRYKAYKARILQDRQPTGPRVKMPSMITQVRSKNAVR